MHTLGRPAAIDLTLGVAVALALVVITGRIDTAPGDDALDGLGYGCVA
jgi:hypothetical protein